MTLKDVEKLKKINAALMERVERSMDQQGNAFSLFQTAIALEQQVRQRTDELASTLRRLEQSNRALKNAKNLAEQANISKTRFLAAASHDVLQPLNAASLSISALADLQTTPQGKQLVRQVEESLATMDELLRTLLDISKLDSGVMRPDLRAIPLNAILLSLRSDFDPIARERNLRIRIRPSSAHVLSDQTMLRRILQNIISNALCYTRTGGVLVGARRRGDMIRIDVADTGPGIPQDQFAAIFEEFYRGSTPGGPDHGNPAGLGLGLSIVKRMASTLGHELTLKSEVGRGTTFQLLVPKCAPARTATDAPGYAPLPIAGGGFFRTKVLLVENDRAVMQAMVSRLESWHCSVRMASQAEEAFDLVGDRKWAPDIILADQHLDDGDLGSRIVEEIRHFLTREVPAVLITADPSQETAERAKALGIELMRKPLKPAELRALMAHLLAEGRTGPTVAQ